MEDNTTASEFLETSPIVDALGLSYGKQECAHEVGMNLFEFYLNPLT